MGCTKQKQSSPARNRQDDSLTNRQPETNYTQNVIGLQQWNEKQIRSKLKSGKCQKYVLHRVTLENSIFNSTIMIRRRNQENLPSKMSI
ncbi:unnamed protein product (macronuclear) [Paramecium tetraurelia]|uniref:Uncharacterized protein n=1 Tax=Paramecium tetraurelia TaxID=5888 RepID=A0CYY9_PARTE|nr:uncharacterized protein GSPATT00011607001 [Paramecium tetraurelia]CAK76006.1 unnamed protein product [Paramecium tetraurelia]|eukprot:XP_001443403.1 hypothetical protein (macronuclear) [Paramecium tetraurelia strain d4-2]